MVVGSKLTGEPEANKNLQGSSETK